MQCVLNMDAISLSSTVFFYDINIACSRGTEHTFIEFSVLKGLSL